MSLPYSNDFLNSYSIENYPVQRDRLIGAGIGGVAGGGLGTLFASLSGANPALGLVGAVPGALVGGGIGTMSARRAAYNDRLAAYNNLSPEQQHSVTRAFVNDMNASVPGVDAGFDKWQSRDPSGFEQFMLKNM